MSMRSAIRSLACALVVAALPLAAANGQGFIKWENAGKGVDLGSGAGVTELSIGGAEKPVAYAVVEGAGLFKSEDFGETWTALKGDAACLAKPCAVAAAPGDGKVVFAGVADAGGGLWASTDAGKMWKKVGDKSKGLASDDVESVAFCAKDPKFILVGHRDGKAVSVSLDGGATWQAKDTGADVKQQIVFALSDTRWVVGSRAGGVVRWTDDSGGQWAAGAGDINYFAGPLPVIQAGDYMYSSSHHGINKSVDGGKSWKFEMGPHTRVVGTAGDLLFREGDRTFIRGTQDRTLNLEMSADFGASWKACTYSLPDIVPEALRLNLVISAEKDPFAHIRIATAWAAAPDGRTVLLGLGKAGLFRGKLSWTPKGPLVAEAKIAPLAVVEGDSKTKVKIEALVTSRTAKVARVQADLTAVGGGLVELFDDGKHDDGEAGDKRFANTATVARGTKAGDKFLGILAEDDAGRLGSDSVKLMIASVLDKHVVWDGDKFGAGLSWVAPQAPLNWVKTQTEEAHNGKVALEFRGEGSGFIGGGWNWFGWYPPNAGTDISKYANLSFWVKLVGDSPGGVAIALNCSATKKLNGKVEMAEYVADEADLKDGKWHEVIIPLRDMVDAASKEFDPKSAWEMDFNSWAPHARAFSLFIDEIGFDNRPVRSHKELVTAPVERDPRPLKAPAAVTAEVDLAAAGTPISPFIYGSSMGDRQVAAEQGLTMMRAGGNPVTPLNWKHGFASSGADWYYANNGVETPPEKNWLVTFHGENKKAGLETYLTIPIMGRVAKDGTSSAFDIDKYPDQESWAAKAQPTDPHPKAGNGRQFQKGPDGQPLKDKDGKPALKDIEADPNDTSVEMSPEEQCDMLKFMIEKMGYGTADKGGVRILALDNEPMLWASTHRGMHPKGTSYDELWERTEKYATLLKKIDPSVKIAGPTLWGWTAYFYSGLDQQLVGRGQGTWEEPLDFKAHGKVPFCKWWMKKLAEHEKATGRKLVDILDWHFYPQTNIYMAGAPNDAKVMEGRVQETRVLWDPAWKDPSWMGKEQGNIIRLLPMMKEWIAECNPGMQTSIGEYNFGGDGDVSGGVAQAELLGLFAREQIDYAFLWMFPAANSPHYFAFKLFRNPDGKKTAFGDRYLPAKVDAPTDVSVHAAKDSKTGRLSFILVNKRAAKDAKVTVKLKKAVPAQDAVFYEYSAADRFSIGQLPARKVGGDKIEVDLPSLSVVRFDLKP